MPKIQLPDGSERQYDNAVTGIEIAELVEGKLEGINPPPTQPID